MNRVFLTGATGFIGGRIAEVLCRKGIPCTTLVRTWKRAARLSRLPVRMVEGDVLSRPSIAEAMRDCDVVIHGAVDNRATGKDHQRTSVEGTANVLNAAKAYGARRVVHLSSVAVFGYAPRADAATEDGVPRYSGDSYCDGKLDAEKVVLDAIRGGLSATILRPTVVYGPFGGLSADLVGAARNRTLFLVDGGRGICNTSYVDNLVQAVLLAAEHENAPGQIFHISDAEPQTWREMCEAHARILGDGVLPLRDVPLSSVRITSGGGSLFPSIRRIREILRDPRAQGALRSIPIVKRAMEWKQKLLPASPPPAATLSRIEADIYTNPVTFSIEKAKRMLGYAPVVSFREGIRRTAEWLQWARLV